MRGFWASCLCTFGNTNHEHLCYISSIHFSQCYQNTLTNISPLIIDSGASVCITPHHSDFINYKPSTVKIKDLRSSNNMAGEGLLRWKVEDVSGQTVNLDLPLPGYHIPGAKVRLLSPQVLILMFGGHTKQKNCNVEVYLADGVVLHAHMCPRSCLPLLPFVLKSDNLHSFWTEASAYSSGDISENKSILSSVPEGITSLAPTSLSPQSGLVTNSHAGL
jgi:hypothetical protein